MKFENVIDLLRASDEQEKRRINYVLTEAEKNIIASSLQNSAQKPYENQKISEYLSFLDDDKIFSTELEGAVRHFVTDGNKTGIFLIENLPTEPLKGEAKDGSLSELILLAMARSIGKPFGYASQRNGEVIQNLMPKRADANKQLGTGSSVDLFWHTEDAHTNLNCDYIALLCLRGDPEAATLASCVSVDDLDPEMRHQLEQKDYIIHSDASYKNKSQLETSVIGYEDGRLILKYDPSFTEYKTKKAEEALTYLTEYMDKHAVGVYLKAGDLLLIDNHCAVHARSKYRPRYDGNDRWLKRVGILTKNVPAQDLAEPHVINL